jgi:signal transduction histidine kinase
MVLRASSDLNFDKISGLSDDGGMESSRRNSIFIVIWILFWVMMVLVAVQDFMRNQPGHALWKPVLWECSSALVSSVLVLVQLRATRGTDRLLGRPWRWFGLQALWLPMYWIAFTPLAFGIRIGVYTLAGQTYHHDAWPQVFLYESMRISIFVGLFTAVRFGIQSYRALLNEKLRAEQANTLLHQAQLQRLTRQMQPHFLFNALNTVSSLIHSDVDQADATLIQLAEVLRTTLELGDAHEASLDTELRLARGYAGVMAARFAERVSIGWQVDESLLAERLPVMSLQPLLENVFKHTVERRRGPTRIDITVAREGSELVLRVDDDAGTLALVPPASETNGIGLANLRARLAALHGVRATLGLFARPSGGVRAELRLPCAS